MKQLLSLCVLAVALVAWSFTSPVHNGYHVGDQARDFELKNVDGKMRSLASIKDAKGYIVVFTCNHCPFALAYQDRIIELHKKYAALGYPVVAINSNDKVVSPDDSYEDMQQRAKDKEYPFVYLHDESQEVAKAFGATRTPHVFLLDNNRTVRYIGAIDDNHEDPSAVKTKYLENAIDALRNGQEISLKETKALGCTIKWKRS
ncbi:MAG: thioredoxin family protein [Saprospiraceae bacterium]|nr:thioredoxin family protein [Saprospiraceae bacterium]